VHEAYVRRCKQEQLVAEDRVQFLSIAGHTMRQVLTDWARAKKRAKRGGGLAEAVTQAQAFLLGKTVCCATGLERQQVGDLPNLEIAIVSHRRAQTLWAFPEWDCTSLRTNGSFHCEMATVSDRPSDP
jgi:hypothetical protein